MNVSEITDERLGQIACGACVLPWTELKALAQAELARRENVEVVKSCDNCGDRVCFQYRRAYDLSMVPCNNWISKAKPPEQAEIDPWIPIPTHQGSTLQEAIKQLQRRLEAVENEMRKQ